MIVRNYAEKMTELSKLIAEKDDKIKQEELDSHSEKI
jgi:hypothetical protein